MAFSAEENAAIRETLLREARRCAVTLGLAQDLGRAAHRGGGHLEGTVL